MSRTIALLAVLGGCAVDATTTTTETSELGLARAGVLVADDLLGASVHYLGAGDGLWPWLASDGAYLHPGADLVFGRTAARTFLHDAYGGPGPAQTLHRVAGDVSADAHLGYTFGWFEQGAGWGRYMAVWRRGAGPWQLAAYLQRDALAAPAPPPADALIIDGEHGTPLPGAPDVLAADRAFAADSVAEGYSIAFPAFAADAAVVTTRRDYRWNRPAVAAFWAGWSPVETLDWAPLVGGAASSGDLGYTVGTSTYHYDDGETVADARTKYITVWVRTPAGDWRWLVDDGNESP